MGIAAAALTERPSVVVISDWVERSPEGEVRDRQSFAQPGGAWQGDARPWPAPGGDAPHVAGGYLERLPLALVAAGMAEQSEIWHHWDGGGPPPFRRENPHLARRAFTLDGPAAPFASEEMLAFIARFGAPHILVVLGLGVAPSILEACANSVIIYNSIDAPALRVPSEASALFDLVITGAQWQSDAVTKLHPGMPTIVLPIGPEFAAADQFRPLGTTKDVDLIYVAAAQPYKRHDILFDALAQLPRDVNAICLFGYGEMGDALRERADQDHLAIEFIGPPGVPIGEVNALMNRARFGVVCGIDDGAPAIITEYMLAGLPVLANAELSCGRQYILPETGMLASSDGFAAGIMTMRERFAGFTPREAAVDRWTWPHSVRNLLQVKKISEKLRSPPPVRR